MLIMMMMMMPSFFSLLSDDLQILFLSLWLDIRSLSTLDVAISCHRLDATSPVLEISGCGRLGSLSFVTDVAIK
jgi:hypothetical protein